MSSPKHPKFTLLFAACTLAAASLVGCKDPSKIELNTPQAQVFQQADQKLHGLVTEISQHKELKSMDDLQALAKPARELLGYLESVHVPGADTLRQLGKAGGALPLFAIALDRFIPYLNQDTIAPTKYGEFRRDVMDLLRWAHIVNENASALPESTSAEYFKGMSRSLSKHLDDWYESEAFKNLPEDDQYHVEQAMLQSFNALQKLAF